MHLPRTLGLLLLSLGLIASPISAAQTEFRGVWVATVYNLDWPSRPGLSAEEQKAELRAILDRAASLHLNAVLFQVRPQSDALYTSQFEPWSEFLTGKAGVAPGYDPLQYAIEQAHARHLQLHAWVNPFRAAIHADAALPANHVARKHPDWVRRFGKQLWIDPGDPDARAYVIYVINDIVKRYAVDGLHLDDYFYPYPLKSGQASFPDDATWRRYGLKSGLSRADWRRQNINDFVRDLYRRVKTTRPRALVGISPFGIWRPGVPTGTRAGLDAYGQLFADPCKWLAEGWCDYLAPQLYWSIKPADQSFPALLNWWRSQSHGHPIWPGIATERIGSKRPAREIIDQIELTREGTRSPGNIQWSMKALMRNQGGIDRLLVNGPYAGRAEPPSP